MRTPRNRRAAGRVRLERDEFRATEKRYAPRALLSTREGNPATPFGRLRRSNGWIELDQPDRQARSPPFRPVPASRDLDVRDVITLFHECVPKAAIGVQDRRRGSVDCASIFGRAHFEHEADVSF